jgi:transcriptional regulator with PAS, ATPase and Fis domain
MFLLIDHFKEELGSGFELTEPVRTFLKEYPWPGNIRELRNVVEYFIYTGHARITMEDLPPTVLKSGQFKLRPVMAAKGSQKEDSYSDAFWFVLEQLYEASQEGIYLGREKLLAKAKERYLPMSQQEVRTILADMAEKGFAKVSRGRGGSRLTLQGRQLWENHS